MDATEKTEQPSAESPVESGGETATAANNAPQDRSLPQSPQDAVPTAATTAMNIPVSTTSNSAATATAATSGDVASSFLGTVVVDEAPASGLRKRKSPRGRKPSAVVEALADSLLPSKLQPFVKKVGPVLDLAADMWLKAQPHVAKARVLFSKAYAKIEPYHPEEWVPVIVGLVLCFFGGCFATTIAAVEAFRISGYATVKQCCKVLYNDQVKVAQAWEKDDAKADVGKMNDQELAKHKFILVCKTVDPNELGRAFAGINTGLLAVIAALRVRFAQAVTLGAAVGIGINNMLAVKVIPDIEKKTRPDFRKWVKPIFNYATKIIGFMLAMFLWKFIMAFHSAMKGAQMACEGLSAYIIRNKLMKIPLTDTNNFKSSKEFLLISSALAGLGFYWQVSHGFELPFPLNFFLLPVTIFEGMLNYFVAV